MKFPSIASIFVIAILMLSAGCSESVDPEVIKYRKALVLSEEPEKPVTIEDARKEIEEKQNVVLVGRVGNKDMPEWWSKGKATLIVSEGMEGSHYNPGPGHDPTKCPFCKWKWKVHDSMAIVNFVDKEGEIIPVDSPTLLGVKQDDVVVLHGVAELDESGFLELSADGVFIRK